MEEIKFVICSNCYEENKYGRKYCYNCGKLLYYNSLEKENNNNEGELEEVFEDYSEEYPIFYYEDNFDTSIKFGNYIMAVDRKKNKLCFYYKLGLEKIIPFENIIECEIVENSNVLQAGGVGRALVGGFLAGRCRCNRWSKYSQK